MAEDLGYEFNPRLHAPDDKFQLRRPVPLPWAREICRCRVVRAHFDRRQSGDLFSHFMDPLQKKDLFKGMMKTLRRSPEYLTTIFFYCNFKF